MLHTPAERNTWADVGPRAGGGHEEGWGAELCLGLGFAGGIIPAHRLSSVQNAGYREAIHQNLSARVFFSKKKNMSFLPAFLALHFDSSSGAEVGALAGGFRNSTRASTDQSGSFVNRS